MFAVSTNTSSQGMNGGREREQSPHSCPQGCRSPTAPSDPAEVSYVRGCCSNGYGGADQEKQHATIGLEVWERASEGTCGGGWEPLSLPWTL